MFGELRSATERHAMMRTRNELGIASLCCAHTEARERSHVHGLHFCAAQLSSGGLQSSLTAEEIATATRETLGKEYAGAW